MEIFKQPLLDYLQVKNPTLFREKCLSGGNTFSKANNYLIPGRIDKWEDFEYDSLQSVYGGALYRVLTREFSYNDFSTIPRVPFRELSDEDSLDTLLTKWNQSVVSEALSLAQGCLYKPQTNKNVYMARGGQARIPEKYRPDWAGIQAKTLHANEDGDTSKSKNILPGDTKVSKKWSSRDIVPGLVQSEHMSGDWLRPLNQLYTYCVKANARYGYIITDQELVVIRIRPILESEDSQSTNDSQETWQDFALAQDDTPTLQTSFQGTAHFPESDEGNDSTMSSPTLENMEDHGRLEYKAIPWSNARSRDPRRCDDLTVNLALWWLHIMASVSSNIKERYAPLKEVAQPTFFVEENSSFVLSETSENTRPKLPIRSRKRSSSLLSDEGTASDGSNNVYPVDGDRPGRGKKRLRAGDEGNENKRQTRSMVVLQN